MQVLASGGKRIFESFNLLRVTIFLSGSTENEDPPYGPAFVGERPVNNEHSFVVTVGSISDSSPRLDTNRCQFGPRIRFKR